MMKSFIFFIVLSLSNQLLADTKKLSVLDEVKARGYLRCGVNVGLSGFSSKDQFGKWSGFDVEFCRALSIAIFNTPDNIEFVGLSGKERFSALKYKKIDVLYRNTTMVSAHISTYLPYLFQSEFFSSTALTFHGNNASISSTASA
jgi:general L-amino acid transport system substrate-binding protein